jgi:hypothetical protein
VPANAQATPSVVRSSDQRCVTVFEERRHSFSMGLSPLPGRAGTAEQPHGTSTFVVELCADERLRRSFRLVRRLCPTGVKFTKTA